jgi:hypothetical protein
MKLLPYNFFVYFNGVLGALLVILPWTLPGGELLGKVLVSILGLLYVIVTLLASGKPLPKLDLIPAKLVILAYFVLAVLSNFSSYLAGFNDNKNLVWLTILVAFFSLLSSIVSNVDQKAIEK